MICSVSDERARGHSRMYFIRAMNEILSLLLLSLYLVVVVVVVVVFHGVGQKGVSRKLIFSRMAIHEISPLGD